MQHLLSFLSFAKRPLHQLGLFGTPDNPITFERGTSAPVWCYLRATTGKLPSITFECDVETYWDADDGHQVIRPLSKIQENEYLVYIKGGDGTTTYVNGAPTFTTTQPRTGGGRKAKRTTLQFCGMMA